MLSPSFWMLLCGVLVTFFVPFRFWSPVLGVGRGGILRFSEREITAVISGQQRQKGRGRERLVTDFVSVSWLGSPLQSFNRSIVQSSSTSGTSFRAAAAMALKLLRMVFRRLFGAVLLLIVVLFLFL